MKLALLVGPPPWSARTRYYMRRLEEQFSPSAILVIREHRSASRRTKYLVRKHGWVGAVPRILAAVWFRRTNHRVARRQEEYFAPRVTNYEPQTPVIHVGDIDGRAMLDWLDVHAPDVVVPLAGPIIKPPLLQRCRWVRWHHGITPDIRGLAAPFWAILLNRPDWLGVTVQELVARIDAGPILAQRCLTPSVDDDLASCYVKLDYLGLELLEAALCDIRDGTSRARSCDPSLGRYFPAPTLRAVLQFPLREAAFFRQFAT